MIKDDKTTIKVAVVSDLHFLQSEENNNVSWLIFNKSGDLKYPLWQSLLDTIKSEDITADVLLCPGDITTFANRAGLEKAWSSLKDLAEALNADIMAAATGNHDVNSRSAREHKNPIRDLNEPGDIIENLKRLTPPYPLIDLKGEEKGKAHSRRIHYFGSDFLIFDDHEDYRIVVFNSCARHTQDPKDYERGLIAESALEWLEDQLSEIHDPKSHKVNLFLCHHHPVQHDEKKLGAYDFMLNGTQLLSMLGKYGSWMVIHGHKHHATVRYDGSNLIKPIPIFSAGTLSAHKDTLGEEGFNNQFYIVEIDNDSVKFGLKGRIKAWTWAANRWIKTRSRKDGIRDGSGFGFRGRLSDIVPQIDSLVSNAAPVPWSKIVEEIPDLNYLTPSDLEQLWVALADLDVDMDEDGGEDGLGSLSRAMG